MERMWSNKLQAESLKLKTEGVDLNTYKNKAHKKISSNISYKLLVLSILLLAFSFLGCLSKNDKKSGKTEQTAAIQFTCPMHPQVIKDAPGSCPICGMDLVKMNREDVHLEVDADLKDLITPTNEAIVSNIQTIHPEELSLSDTILLNGKVGYDTRQIKTITTRFGGRVERMFVKYNFQKVNKGQKIMEIYSPDLAAAQQELLYLKAQDNSTLLERGKEKLRLLGISNQQINQIISSGKVNYSIPIYSNYSGYVVDPQMDKSLNKMTEQAVNQQNAISFIEGQYVKTGDMLFKVFNQQQVWGIFYANAAQQQFFKNNQSVTIQNERDTIKTRINLVQPYYDNGQPYTLIRVAINNNQQRFHIGELLKAQYISPSVQGLWIPEHAVYKLGERTIVFIKKESVLTAKTVKIGVVVGKRILILKGLEKEDEIAKNAAYLIDTESFIQIN